MLAIAAPLGRPCGDPRPSCTTTTTDHRLRSRPSWSAGQARSGWWNAGSLESPQQPRLVARGSKLLTSWLLCSQAHSLRRARPGSRGLWPPEAASLTELTGRGALGPPGDALNLARWTWLWTMPRSQQDRIPLEADVLWCDRQPVQSPGFCEKGSSLTSGTGIWQVCPGLAVLSSKAPWLQYKVGALSREFNSNSTREIVACFIITTHR